MIKAKKYRERGWRHRGEQTYHFPAARSKRKHRRCDPLDGWV